MISLLFHLLWGMNYYRVPLNSRLKMNLSYDEISLNKTLEFLVNKTNDLHSMLSVNDTLPVIIPYKKEKLSNMLEKEFKINLITTNIKTEIKNSIISELISYMGFAGYLNPFTLESQVNKNIPSISYITTASHEMAHQTGIASESEANFIAIISTINHPDPFIKYSGYTFALKHCYNDLSKKNPEVAKKTLSKLKKGIYKNFTEVSLFWKVYQNPLEPYFKSGYDKFLKAEGQKQGIKTYSEVVSYVVNYFNENLK
jgi:hypothetical protein